MIREITCINCPMGCQLTVTLDGEEVTKVEGNQCEKGKTYAMKEVTNPTRIVTGSVCVIGNDKVKMVSVKTERDIPKDMIFECARALDNITVKSPVKVGDVIIENVAGTGVNIIATRGA